MAAAPRCGGSTNAPTSASKKTLYAAEQKRAEVARARRRWMREQGMFGPARLVFIDETCAHTKMVRLYSRSPRGERLIGYVPHGHWKTITFVAGLRLRRITAPSPHRPVRTVNRTAAPSRHCAANPMQPSLSAGSASLSSRCRSITSPTSVAPAPLSASTTASGNLERTVMHQRENGPADDKKELMFVKVVTHWMMYGGCFTRMLSRVRLWQRRWT